MSIEDVSKLLINASRPIDVFGNVSEKEIKKKYKEYAKITHPDLVGASKSELATKCIKLLNEFYEKALKELEDNIYYLTELKEIYKMKEPLFDITIKNKTFSFYDAIREGDVAVCYYGLNEEDEEIILKYPIDTNDSDLIDKEYSLLNRLDHISIPKVNKKIVIDGRSCIIMPKVNGISLYDVITNYNAISDRHVAWMLERMLSTIGYLHYNKIIHGNIKPENLIVDVNTHNVTLVDYTLSIIDANASGAKYAIINEDYSPKYVLDNHAVIPHVDIYAVGKIAVELLGGDIKSNGMPISSSANLRNFIRKMINVENNDAWALWDELIKLRNEDFGTSRFQKLVLKKKVG